LHRKTSYKTIEGCFQAVLRGKVEVVRCGWILQQETVFIFLNHRKSGLLLFPKQVTTFMGLFPNFQTVTRVTSYIHEFECDDVLDISHLEKLDANFSQQIDTTVFD